MLPHAHVVKSAFVIRYKNILYNIQYCGIEGVTIRKMDVSIHGLIKGEWIDCKYPPLPSINVDNSQAAMYVLNEYINAQKKPAS